ncbi:MULTISPECIES: SDR family NAD(P)-dependent oxidoreductase [unclassified Coleofasciculus]|uniref:SDR family NAD(P)-dependent oxidoreductase n=1 Tax=unclassified Coleofasciculus TaxID=2692782 RepID=UPI001881C0B5|nr:MULTISPECIES: SDR family oxidoreductase [unclassified Coleofasciculus]MBE9129781.1 SDR family oxidoreductase [Coleofasciculus sp. LEGE 07081]MBE9150378.1 SDR family oxidoreductase [Coleofasciculus sp. LEGE 07092]
MSTALITGASGGIGAAFAKKLAKRNTDLVLVARSQGKLEQLAKQLYDKYQIQADVIVQDLTEPDAAARVFEAVSQKNITIDLLINNAGFGDYGSFSQSSRTKQIKIVQLNVLALVDLTYQFLPQMQERGSGSIINISSIAGFQPLPYLSVYSASKAFVTHFSEALWAENQHTGVKILAVCPGPTESNFFETAGFSKFASGSERQNVDSPEDVVRESLNALEADECTVVPGRWNNKVTVNLSRFVPRKMLAQLVEPQFRPRS